MTVKEKLVYLFRNALIQYGREQGFKNPHESADKDIEEMLLFFLTHEKKVQREVVKDKETKVKNMPTKIHMISYIVENSNSIEEKKIELGISTTSTPEMVVYDGDSIVCKFKMI